MRIDYYKRVRSSNAGCLMSTVCTYCYRAGGRVSFFGEKPNGGVVLGVRDVDYDFGKRIWLAAQKHLAEVHGKTIINNGRGGWKVVSGE